MLTWNDGQWRALAEWCRQRGNNRLKASIEAMLKTKKSSSRTRQIREIYIMVQSVRNSGTSSGQQSSRTAAASKRASRGPSRSVASGGEAMALYNRLGQLNKGVAFEESVALRQSSRSDRRRLLARVDRALAGSQDDLDDIDW